MSLDDIPDDEIGGYIQITEEPFVMDAIKYQFYVLLDKPLPTLDVDDLTFEYLYNKDFEFWEVKERTVGQLPKEMRMWISIINREAPERLKGSYPYCFFFTVAEDFERARSKMDLTREEKADETFKDWIEEEGYETLWTHTTKVKLFPWERPRKGKKIPIPAKFFKDMIKKMEETQ